MDNQKEIIKLFKAKSSGVKGWYIGDCPYCRKEDHLGIIFEGIGSFHCWKCKVHGILKSLLEKVNRLDLYSEERTIISNEFIKLELFVKQELDLCLKEIKPPIGYRRIFSHLYLESRGFTSEQFSIFEVGTTDIHPILKKDYVVFLIKDEDVCVGYIARSIKSKEEIEKINIIRKKKGLKKYLRYINSFSDFGKILFGYDEIIPYVTKSVVLVEGVFGKFNIDRLLDLYSQDDLKCNSTNGNKISLEQIEKLRIKRVENIILLYDPDAVSQSKMYSMELNKYFDVKVGFIHGNKDPGDLNFDELNQVLNNLQSPLSFFINNVSRKSLV